MSTNNDTPNRAARFLERLRKITNDRGKMAALRRAAPTPALTYEKRGEDIANLAACTVGALYAQHPEEDTNA